MDKLIRKASALRISTRQMILAAAIFSVLLMIVVWNLAMSTLPSETRASSLEGYRVVTVAYAGDDLGDKLEADVKDETEADEEAEPEAQAEPEPKVEAKPETNEPTFPVQITCDGKKAVHHTTRMPVKDVLAEYGVTLGEHDLVNLDVRDFARNGDSIVVTRQEYVIREDHIDLPYETNATVSPNVPPRGRVVKTPGQTGLRVDTYSTLVVDGVPQKEELVSQELVKEPVTEVALVGFQVEPVSKLDFESEFDENGEPVGYSGVLRNGKAAGYWAPAGSSTSTGLSAQVGHVAVNPNVIPYGSKLYIRSTDGFFIYGYAVAADTGTSLMNGVIDVDLFYNTYAECVENGMRRVNIYVLE